MLRKRIAELQHYRRMGLSTVADIDKYETDLVKRVRTPPCAAYLYLISTDLQTDPGEDQYLAGLLSGASAPAASGRTAVVRCRCAHRAWEEPRARGNAWQGWWVRTGRARRRDFRAENAYVVLPMTTRCSRCSHHPLLSSCTPQPRK